MGDIRLTDVFRSAFPIGIFGALTAQGCANRRQPVALAEEQRAVESRLRARVGAGSIDSDLIAGAYALYFRRYGGRYPVVHQAKTVLAGRSIESSSALVEAMFTAELDSLVLTCGRLHMAGCKSHWDKLDRVFGTARFAKSGVGGSHGQH